MGCNTSKVACEDAPPPPAVLVNPPPFPPPPASTKSETKVEEESRMKTPMASTPTPMPSTPTPMASTPTPIPPPTPIEEQVCNARLLLLGASESGKTTLLQQIRFLYMQNYSEAEMYHRRGFIYFYILKSIRHLIQALRDSKYDFDTLESKHYAEIIMTQNESQRGLFPDYFANWIKVVWNDPVVQKIYRRRSRFNVSDNIRYFLDNFDKINSLDYNPTPMDFIMCYVPTVGLNRMTFTANKQTFNIIDIGGNKLIRKKWPLVYDGVDGVFFCISVSEYDQTMSEDPKVNRLKDSIELFRQTCAEPVFEKIPIFLFLNECDVFFEKISRFPLKEYFPDFKGTDEDEALNFIEDMATKAAGNRSKNQLKVVRVVAIDTEPTKKTLQKIFKDVVKIKNSSS